jgi:hypothetical protein
MPQTPAAWALLEGLDEGLLRRLLAPYVELLAQKGAPPADDMRAWRDALEGALRPDAPDKPAPLQHALWAIAALASPEGEAELRVLAAERGVSLSTAVGRPAAVAAEAYLDHRALWRDARARLGSRRMGLSVIYGAPPDRAPRRLSPAGHAALRRGGVSGEGTLDATIVAITDLPHELVALYERPVPLWTEGPPDAALVVVFDKVERVLSIDAADPEEQERLRSLFGRVLYGDEAAFRPAQCLTGAPFRELGESSLHAAGVEGLATVHLRKLVVRTADAGHLAFSAEADDLAGALGADGPLRDMLRLGEVAHWALAFFVAGRAPFRAEFYLPNRWRLDDRRDVPLVRSFLALRGFLKAG